MPAQKRSHDTAEDDPLHSNDDNDNEEEEPEDGNESDRSPSSSNGEKDESSAQQEHEDFPTKDRMDMTKFISVKLSEIRKEVQCPICLGIIRKTRTVMECLHRFCRECIDKSMRMGNNECPACRTHCASRRSLRDDPNYDALIAALYPDIDKYEEEELAFHEEEKARNKQIQASIAQTFRRQSEALGRKKTTAKATAAAFMRRSQGSYRKRKNQASDDDEDANGNDGGKDSSSNDERSIEVKPKRPKRWGGARFSRPSSAAGSADGGGDENDSEVNRETLGALVGLVGNSEMLAWGKGGMRSHTRYGSVGGGNGKNARNSRLSKLGDCFRNIEDNDDELDIDLMLVSFDEQRMPSLQHPYLCCRPSLSVRHICQYVALQTQFQTDEVELLMVRDLDSKINLSTGVPISNSSMLNMCKDGVQTLEAQETLGGLQAISNSKKGRLLLTYRPKVSTSQPEMDTLLSFP